MKKLTVSMVMVSCKLRYLQSEFVQHILEKIIMYTYDTRCQFLSTRPKKMMCEYCGFRGSARTPPLYSERILEIRSYRMQLMLMWKCLVVFRYNYVNQK